LNFCFWILFSRIYLPPSSELSFIIVYMNSWLFFSIFIYVWFLLKMGSRIPIFVTVVYSIVNWIRMIFNSNISIRSKCYTCSLGINKIYPVIVVWIITWQVVITINYLPWRKGYISTIIIITYIIWILIIVI